jgi:hypothetical protein
MIKVPVSKTEMEILKQFVKTERINDAAKLTNITYSAAEQRLNNLRIKILSCTDIQIDSTEKLLLLIKLGVFEFYLQEKESVKIGKNDYAPGVKTGLFSNQESKVIKHLCEKDDSKNHESLGMKESAYETYLYRIRKKTFSKNFKELMHLIKTGDISFSDDYRRFTRKLL